MYCGQKLGGSSSDHETRSHIPQITPDASDESRAGTRDTPDGYSADDYAPEPAPEEVGGYRLGRMLGAGGMGSVYEAEAVGGKARVAVKLLSSRLAANPSSVERFRQEGRLASQLAHPRCVFVYSADTENGRPYIVMELMPGRTLKDLVDERGPLPVHEAIARVLDVIDGLAEAHRVGMIHRDVKPSNCFLTADDRVKVGDFGLSKSLTGVRASSLTQTGAFLGTVLFAAPEQIRGEPVDYTADVYSVAATLYFLLCGEAPFQHESAAAVLARVVSEPAPRVRAKRKDVPAALEKVICRGLERDRARRWPSLDDLREALCDLLPERRHPARPRAMVGAYLLDRTAVGLLAAPLEGLAMWASGAQSVDVDLFELHWLSLAVLIAYFALFEGRLGATPGKWLLGLRVSRVGATGPPGVGPALARVLVFHGLLGGLVYAPAELVRVFGPAAGGFFGTLVFVLSAAALLAQTRKSGGFRGLHDRASGCQVTQKPFPARKLRLAVAAPTPLDNVLPTADPLPDVGGFVVRGRLAVDTSGEQVWLAEDRALGRKVLLWLRPWGSAGPSADPARPTRLRRLGSGSVGWAGAAYDWTAYAAPLGGPLAEAVRPGKPLPWADARHLLEQLADEFRAAAADGSLPRKLALDHIWVEPNGRVQVLDFPLCAARYRPGPPLAVLREAASLLLEGSPRATGGAPAAPLPAHARAAFDPLFEAEPDPAEFRAALAETHAHRSEVTTAVRAAQLSIQAVLLAGPLGVLFAVAFTIPALLTFGAGVQERMAKRAAAVLADPAERRKLADGANRELGEALNSPRLTARVADLVAQAEAEHAARRAALLGPHRRMMDVFDLGAETDTAVRSPQAVAEVVLWAGAPPNSPRGRRAAPWGGPGSGMVAIFGALAAGLVALAAALRGGASLLLAGIAVVRTDGRPASRLQCAARAALVWLPPVGLLLGSALVQVYAPAEAALAAALWVAALVLLPAYVLVALRYPARPPHDRLTGTHLVPG
jgi:uncharacterized RDD family membrane protein YckC